MEWIITFLKDVHAIRVFDLCAGSGATACAAAFLGIPYEGIAMNAKHAAWLNNIMDKAIFAIVHLRQVEADSKNKNKEAATLQKDVMTYFKDLVEEGRKFVERQYWEEDEDDIDDIDENAGKTE